MEFKEITIKEYEKFWENHPLKTFLSAKEISMLRKNTGWDSYFVGVEKDKKLVAAAMLLAKKRHFNKKEFYSPRGFLIDFEDFELIDFFIGNLRKFIKEKGGYILRIDPYVIKQERDIDGNIVDGGINHQNVVSHLKKQGFIQIPDKDLEQVGWMFSLNLENKTKEEILKEMSSSTRNTIRKTEKIGIHIRELQYDELDEFQKIMVETGERKNFAIRDLSYFQSMYKLFSEKEEVKYYITELNLDDYITSLEKEKQEKQEKKNNLSDAKYNDGEKKNLENQIKSIDKRIMEAEEIKQTKKKSIITLSGSMFILIKPEIIYLSSGNYSEYMKFNSQYLLQWMMIQYGIEHGFKKHNFYGIPAHIETHPKDYGIYEFKRGFNGVVEELIGEFHLPITWHYYLIKLLKKIRH